MAPGKRWMAGGVRKIGSRSAAAIAAGSSEPRRSSSTYGPENAFWTVTCWSSAKPISSAIGSVAMSALASSESVKYRRSGTKPRLPVAVLLPRARRRRPAAEAEVEQAGRALLAAPPPRVPRQPAAQPPRAERVQRVGHEPERDEDHAEHHDLKRGVAGARVDELREERQEEQRDLRIAELDERSLAIRAPARAVAGRPRHL